MKAKLSILLLLIICTLQACGFESNVIDKVESKFGPIWIYGNKDIKCMSFIPPGKIAQSCVDIRNPDKLIFDYYKMMMASLYINNPKKILVIGLGGGILPRTFASLLPTASVDAVEINPKVQEVAEKYFDFAETENLKVFIQDGADFVKNKENTYDLIILDAYDKEYIPPHLLTKDFFRDIKKALTQTGVLAINSFKNTKYTQIEDNLIKETFGDSIYLLRNNRVILTSNSKLPNLDQIIEQSRLWELSFARFGVDTKWLLDSFQNNDK